jgi:hypothetical protein
VGTFRCATAGTKVLHGGAQLLAPVAVSRWWEVGIIVGGWGGVHGGTFGLICALVTCAKHACSLKVKWHTLTKVPTEKKF